MNPDLKLIRSRINNDLHFGTEVETVVFTDEPAPRFAIFVRVERLHFLNGTSKNFIRATAADVVTNEVEQAIVNVIFNLA